MKQIIALLLATVTLLTFGSASGSDWWGGSELEGRRLVPSARDDTWVPVGALVDEAASVKVVPLSIEPAAANLPGALSVALPHLDEAIQAIRAVVAKDPMLSTNLKARGFGPDDIVGLRHGPKGDVTLFVSSEA